MYDFILGCHFLRQHGFIINFGSNTLELLQPTSQEAVFHLRARDVVVLEPFCERLVDVQGIVSSTAENFFVSQHPSFLPDTGAVVAKGILNIPSSHRYDNIITCTVIVANVTNHEVTILPGWLLCQVEPFDPGDYNYEYTDDKLETIAAMEAFDHSKSQSISPFRPDLDVNLDGLTTDQKAKIKLPC